MKRIPIQDLIRDVVFETHKLGAGWTCVCFRSGAYLYLIDRPGMQRVEAFGP